jgi:ATP diphosphatase
MISSAAAEFTRLVEIVARLRAPGGCPWDREQTIDSLKPFVLEETYEVLETIDHHDHGALREELGDFLYQAVFLAQLEEEAGHFAIADSVRSAADKLVRRHPHVFATGEGEPPLESAGQVRAYHIGIRAASVGFDWTAAQGVIDKIQEEVDELRDVVEGVQPIDRERAEEELGDVLFSIANLSRQLGIEPETALRKANDKFTRRFEMMDRSVASSGRRLRDLTLEELEHEWQRAKAGGNAT